MLGNFWEYLELDLVERKRLVEGSLNGCFGYWMYLVYWDSFQLFSVKVMCFGVQVGYEWYYYLRYKVCIMIFLVMDIFYLK